MKMITLYADIAGPRQWLMTARERLARSGCDVTLARAVNGRNHRSSGSLLRTCERIDGMINGKRGTGLAARLSGETAACFASDAMADGGTAIAVRYQEDGTQPRRQGMQILYDGTAGDEALFARLLEGRAPRIEIVDIDNGDVLAAGVASLEGARSLMAAADAVYARVLTLVEAALICDRAPNGAPARTDPVSRAIGPSQALRQMRSGLLRKPIRAAYEAACHFPHWRIGWRFTSGASLWDKASLDGPAWHILPDPGDHFYADPFPIVRDGRRMIFFEDFDHRRGKAAIAAVDVRDDGSSGPVVQVLEEPWHLSYPFMIEDGGELWMIPESSAARTVDLYRATRFPDRWVKEATLLSDVEASDATVVRYRDAFWMFASVRDGAGSHSDSLCIFTATALTGPWRAHRRNPVLVDARSARPAGNMIFRDGALWRPAQVCDRTYGAGVALCEVTRLDDDGFEQAVRHVLRPGPMWPGSRLHTLNEAFGIACIDGWAASPRNRHFARWLEPWCLRREARR